MQGNVRMLVGVAVFAAVALLPSSPGSTLGAAVTAEPTTQTPPAASAQGADAKPSPQTGRAPSGHPGDWSPIGAPSLDPPAICPPDDANEPNQNFAQATPITPGTLNGTICDDDYFALSAAVGALTVSLDFTHAQGDLDLFVYDSSQTMVRNSQSLADHESVFFIVPTAGTYYIKVVGYSGAQNTYSLTTGTGLCPPDDASEPNNSFATATPIRRQINGTAIVCDDDYYAFNAVAGSSVSVTITFTNSVGDLDMSAFTPGQQLIDVSDSVLNQESITFVAPTTGTYYFRVYGYAGATNVYTIIANHTLCPPDDAFEPNNSIAAATVPPGPKLSGVACPSDPDFYRIDMPRPGWINAIATFQYTLGDVDLTLYNSSNVEVASATNTIGDREWIWYASTSAGTYYLKVQTKGATEKNTYDLTLTVSRTESDFNGDGLSEATVYRPSTGGWFTAGGWLATAWGTAGDVPIAADYNGDLGTDVAVFRPSDQTWYVQPSAAFPAGLTTQWGIPGDIPVPADYNGDGKADVAVYRPADQTWYVQPSASFPAGLATQWGIPGDVPIPADYNGDGIDEVAVYRPSDQTWYSQSSPLATQWGIPGDLPIPADYNGDGRTDVGVYRPSDQTWYVQASASFPAGLATQWGVPGDQAAVADYDGDGIADITVFRPSDQTWYTRGSYSGDSGAQWGAPGDVAVVIPYATRLLY